MPPDKMRELAGGLRDGRARERTYGSRVAAGPLLAELREKREEEARQRHLAEQRRYEEQQLRKLDNNRWRRFVEIAKQRRDDEMARGLLELLKTGEVDLQRQAGNQSIADWISWAEKRIADGTALTLFSVRSPLWLSGIIEIEI